MMGGRGSGSNMTSSNRNNSSSTARITGGSVTGDFIQSRDGVWESETKAYSAAMLAGPNREPKGILEPRFTIVEGEHRGNTTYRLYEQHVGRKEFIKRFRSPNEAAKWANKSEVNDKKKGLSQASRDTLRNIEQGARQRQRRNEADRRAVRRGMGL